MPQASLHKQELSYPGVSTISSPQGSAASLSRCLGQRHMPKTSITQFSPEHSDEDCNDSQGFWSRNITHYFSPTKEDLLRVLKGKNHHPSFPLSSQSSVEGSKKRHQKNVLTRNLTTGNEKPLLRRINKAKRAKIFEDSLAQRER